MTQPILTTLRRYHQRLNGSTIQYDLSVYQSMLDKTKARIPTLASHSKEQLRSQSDMLRQRAAAGESLDELVVEAFALVWETVRRVLHQEPFDVQLLGAIALHQGRLAEMQTGEGKTLTAVFPAYLHALSGAGVHVLTFNDYLARRDAQWMGPVYESLGLSVGFVQAGMGIAARQSAYGADVTYLTAKESGFDYLRDSLVSDPAGVVHRGLNFALIDEADSILIDEARVPLVIAGASPDRTGGHARIAGLVAGLERGRHFEFDQYARNVHLTESGVEHVESVLSCGNLYDAGNADLLALVSSALHAHFLLHRDKDYIVRNNRVEIVDEFTGRVADKRRWPDGIQAAVEAKEGCRVQAEGRILNTIPLQHFLRLYSTVSGMTATAQPAEEEFRAFYGLHIVVIPQNRASVRMDERDVVFLTKAAKRQAVLDEIARVHATGRPVLVGTQTVQESTDLAEALRHQGVGCEVLNASHDEHEARVIAQAGMPGAVTISTNMAGRGTDIRLGGTDEHAREEVVALGGLYVIGTNRFESRRIDNQLRGRAGRQGDPGSSRFFVSLEDDLFVRYRLSELLPPRPSHASGSGLEVPLLRSEIDRVQRIVEGQNLEIKLTLFKYSLVLEQQRQIVHAARCTRLAGTSCLSLFRTHLPEHCGRIERAVGSSVLVDLCMSLALRCTDRVWSEYLADMADLRDGIHLRRIGGQDPLYEFRKLSIERFEGVEPRIEALMLEAFSAIVVENGIVEVSGAGPKAPSETWTYLVNDDPFEHTFRLQLGGVSGFSVAAAFWWPLTLLFLLLGKSRVQKGPRG